MRVGILKVVAFILGGVVTALAAAALYVLAFFDVGRLATDATQWMKERHQRQLRMESVELKLWPRPYLQLKNLRLSERQSEGEFVAFSNARLRLALMPLLYRQVRIDGAELDGLRFALRRDRDGRFNMDDLIEVGANGSPVEFDLAELRANGANIVWRDDMAAGFAGRVSEANLTAGPITHNARGEIRLSGRFEIASLGMDARGLMLANYQSDAKKPGLRLGAINLAAQGDHGGVKGNSDLRLADVRLSSDQPLFAATASFVLRGQTGAAPFELSASTGNLRANADGLRGGAVQGMWRLTGERLFGDVALTATAMQSRGGWLALEGMKLESGGLRLGNARLNGTLTGSLELAPGAKRMRLAGLEGKVALAHPALGTEPRSLAVSGNTELGATADRLEGGLALKANDTTLKGTWSLTRQAPASFRFDLDADRLDLDRYLSTSTGSPGKAPSWNPRIDLSGLGDTSLDGILRVGSLKLAGVRLGDVRLPVHAAADRISVDPWQASLYGGTASGSIVLASEGPGLTLRAQAQGVNFGPLFKDLSEREWLAGRGALSLTLQGKGNTLSELGRSLEGSGKVQLKDAGVRGLDLAAALHDWRGAIQSSREAQRGYREGESMPLGDVTASLSMANRKVRIGDLQSRTRFKVVTGSGEIDLDGRRVDWLGQLTLTAVPPGVLPSLRGQPLALRLAGTFGQPVWRYQPAGGR